MATSVSVYQSSLITDLADSRFDFLRSSQLIFLNLNVKLLFYFSLLSSLESTIFFLGRFQQGRDLVQYQAPHCHPLRDPESCPCVVPRVAFRTRQISLLGWSGLLPYGTGSIGEIMKKNTQLSTFLNQYLGLKTFLQILAPIIDFKMKQNKSSRVAGIINHSRVLIEQRRYIKLIIANFTDPSINTRTD